MPGGDDAEISEAVFAFVGPVQRESVLDVDRERVAAFGAVILVTVVGDAQRRRLVGRQGGRLSDAGQYGLYRKCSRVSESSEREIDS